ncbi:MAG: hypothetical protein ACE5RK_03265 [Candidatus Nitrosomaritimum aestuariumsis]|jgi:choline kinase|nr:hypothetical protein [Nitrosopumilaceae archaeon]
MKGEDVRKLIDEVNQREKKDYQKMNIEELSGELRGVMEFERSIFEKIEEMEKKGTESDLINYAKMIIKNTTGREISEIQEIYLEKIDRDYLSS